MNKILYELFHSKSKIQTKIVSDKNFTYRNIIYILNKYITKSQKILDIGCGVGTISLYLANKGNKVFGIDISKNAITTARESAKHLGLKNVYFEEMKFPNKTPKEKFNVIICFEVLEHLRDDSLAIKKIFSLLNPGGFALFSVPAINAPLHKLQLTKEFDKKVGHLRRYKEEDLIEIIKKQGFEIMKTNSKEGIVRNFLFVNPYAGKLVRFIKFFLSDMVTYVDELVLHIFGHSDFFVIAKKPL